MKGDEERTIKSLFPLFKYMANKRQRKKQLKQQYGVGHKYTPKLSQTQQKQADFLKSIGQKFTNYQTVTIDKTYSKNQELLDTANEALHRLGIFFDGSEKIKLQQVTDDDLRYIINKLQPLLESVTMRYKKFLTNTYRSNNRDYRLDWLLKSAISKKLKNAQTVRGLVVAINKMDRDFKEYDKKLRKSSKQGNPFGFVVVKYSEMGLM
ncbi:unknown [Streptococcus phage C1]|uniref:Uncharacterized protein n=1 Tax=Streptococcus phage C1 TaxID=2907838 RepID=Q7Y3F7_BPSC1|nr:hypothetical protein C1p05 [Streptococcus phage C1]AAP42304.1 unknown [Streptococcus phage C1]